MTAAASISMSMRGFEEAEANRVANIVATYIRELSRYIELSNLDGVTVAYDYHQALIDLDRGYQTSFKLEASTEFVEGVAMTPLVMRDGRVKSHIVFNAIFVLPLADPSHERHDQSLHLIAHECAHVQVSQAFDRCFPNVLLQQTYSNLYDLLRANAIGACWDEFAATFIAAGIGRDPTADYEKCFIDALSRTRDLANERIRAYRLHADHSQILNEVYVLYADLIKFACYHLGNMAGRGLTLDDLPTTKGALEGSWFYAHWTAIERACIDICDRFGQWDNMGLFDALGDVADGVLASGGVFVTRNGADAIRMDIPFTPDTMPSAA
jgi:hypothetical protein